MAGLPEVYPAHEAIDQFRRQLLPHKANRAFDISRDWVDIYNNNTTLACHGIIDNALPHLVLHYDFNVRIL